MDLIEETYEWNSVVATAASPADEMGCNSSKSTGTVEAASPSPSAEHAEGHQGHDAEQHENAEHRDDDHGQGDD